MSSMGTASVASEQSRVGPVRLTRTSAFHEAMRAARPLTDTVGQLPIIADNISTTHGVTLGGSRVDAPSPPLTESHTSEESESIQGACAQQTTLRRNSSGT